MRSDRSIVRMLNRTRHMAASCAPLTSLKLVGIYLRMHRLLTVDAGLGVATFRGAAGKCHIGSEVRELS